MGSFITGRLRLATFLLPMLAGLAVLAGPAVVRPSAAAEQAAAQPRTWTDISGKYTTRAVLLEVTDDAVVLQTDAGRRITVPLSRLSEADRGFARRAKDEGTGDRANSTGANRDATGADRDSKSQQVGLKYVNPVTNRIRLGLEVTARGGPLSNLVCTFPVPGDWPEQEVEILDREESRGVTRVTFRDLADGVRQCEFRVRGLPEGESAQVVLQIKVKRFQIEPPERPERLRFARPVPAEARPYLGESPFIETKHPRVRAAAEEIVLDESAPAWKQVETIYDWTLERVQHEGTRPLKGALQAVTTGKGDCEERTSLFVAMCRLKGIPARSVWVTGHAYPEFYLQTPKGEGLWIPCESLGERVFGGMPRYRLIMQKGDRFHMPQKRGPQRYVSPTVSGTIGRGGGQAVLREIRENVAPGPVE